MNFNTTEEKKKALKEERNALERILTYSEKIKDITKTFEGKVMRATLFSAIEEATPPFTRAYLKEEAFFIDFSVNIFSNIYSVKIDTCLFPKNSNGNVLMNSELFSSMLDAEFNKIKLEADNYTMENLDKIKKEYDEITARMETFKSMYSEKLRDFAGCL